MTLMPLNAFITASDLCGELKPETRIIEYSRTAREDISIWQENGWLIPGRNPCAIYLYLEDVDGLAAALQDLRSGRRGPENKPWGMYEFAIPDPDETLVRVGWPSRLRQAR
jgi:hypothetical protein